MIGPTGSDLLGTPWRLAVHQHHVGMPGVDMVELGPDQLMIVEIEAAGESDLGAGREQDLLLGALSGGDEIVATDHRRGEIAVIDPEAAMREPGLAGVTFLIIARLVAHQFERILVFYQRPALGDEAFEFNRSDFTADVPDEYSCEFSGRLTTVAAKALVSMRILTIGRPSDI